MKIILITILMIFVSIPVFGIETYTSPDGKWLATKQFTKDLNPTIGLDSTDNKVHKYHMILYISDKIVSTETIYSNSFRKMLDYKKPFTIQPNFVYIKILIYVDDQAVLAYDFYTNATGMITFSSHRWLIY